MYDSQDLNFQVLAMRDTPARGWETDAMDVGFLGAPCSRSVRFSSASEDSKPWAFELENQTLLQALKNSGLSHKDVSRFVQTVLRHDPLFRNLSWTARFEF